MRTRWLRIIPLSGSDRLHLLRYSGISARNGEIHYENPVGSVSVEVRQVESIASMETGGENDVGENSVSDSYLFEPDARWQYF